MQFYQYTPCEGSEGVIFTSNINPVNIAGNTITFPGLLINGELITGQCYFISQANSLKPGFTPDVTIDWNTEIFTTYPSCSDCVAANIETFDCVCSTATNTTGVTDTWRYIDCEGNLISGLELEPGETSPKVCVREWVNLDGNIQFYGECINDECPSFYLLTDCSDETNTFCSNSTALEPYTGNGIAVTLFGEAYVGKCWTITSTAECESSVFVTVEQHFPVGCGECLNQFVINYELQNCADDSIIYTSTDLSEYVGQVVQLDTYDDNCWIVRVLSTGIPSDTPVQVLGDAYKDCIECSSTYFLLEDCNTDADTQPIVTITDLSVYVGQVITLTTCPEICWTVSETDYSSDYQVIKVESDYLTCTDCIVSNTKSTCITFTNTLNFSVSVNYTDLVGVVQKVDINGKTTTPKLCALLWDTTEGITVTKYGECVNGECPIVVQPKRKVTPGYDTPACSTDYYEKVVCNFSEWMYKDVLQKRYGISNCCPEELLKWHIKYEMLMLDILVNPDYECTPTTDCHCPVIGGMVLNTACLDVRRYIIERCDEPGITEVVQIENSYDVLGNVIIINELCYTVIEPTNRVVTVYWTPGTIYATCEECAPSIFSYNCVDFQCVEIEGNTGQFLTLQECIDNCSSPIQLPCDECINITVIPAGGGDPVNLILPPTGVYTNGTVYYYFNIDGIDYEIYNETWDTTDPPGEWLLYDYNANDDIGVFPTVGTCPVGTFDVQPIYFNSFVVDYCNGTLTGFVLYSVFVNTGGNTGVYFTYPDCNNIIQQYDVPLQKGTTTVYVCSTPGRPLTDFVQFGGTQFNVTETAIPCNC